MKKDDAMGILSLLEVSTVTFLNCTDILHSVTKLLPLTVNVLIWKNGERQQKELAETRTKQRWCGKPTPLQQTICMMINTRIKQDVKQQPVL